MSLGMISKERITTYGLYRQNVSEVVNQCDINPSCHSDSACSIFTRQWLRPLSDRNKVAKRYTWQERRSGCISKPGNT